MNLNLSKKSFNSYKSYSEYENTVDQYLSKVGYKPFVLLIIFICAICYSTTGSLIYLLSINTYIPNRTCTNKLTKQSYFIANDNDQAYQNYCQIYRDSLEYDCSNDDKQPFNVPVRFNLECTDDMKLKFVYLGTLFNIFMIVGAALVGFFIDKFGRKTTMLIGGVIYISSLTCTIYAKDYWYFLLAYGSLGFCGEFFYMPAYVLATDIVSKNRSKTVGTVINTLDGCNSIIYIVMYYYTQNMWNILIINLFRCLILSIIVLIICPESPYYLYVTNRIEECNKYLYYLSYYSGMDDIPLVDKVQYGDKEKMKENDKIYSRTIYYEKYMVLYMFLGDYVGYWRQLLVNRYHLTLFYLYHVWWASFAQYLFANRNNLIFINYKF